MLNFMIKKFVLRVYGILIKDDQVLLADECLNGFSFTKFPGGGVELGEGIAEALKREIVEEGQLEVTSYEHFYTTDFFSGQCFPTRRSDCIGVLPHRSGSTLDGVRK